jgi:acetoin:2,6-dichlorophenolindophenol oxidoreductase subunit alpha
VKLKRFFGHFEGDAMTYRADGEVDRIRAENDSLKIFRRRATEAKLLNDSDLDAVEARVARLIDEAVAAAEADEFPKDSDLLTDVYISY